MSHKFSLFVQLKAFFGCFKQLILFQSGKQCGGLTASNKLHDKRNDVGNLRRDDSPHILLIQQRAPTRILIKYATKEREYLLLKRNVRIKTLPRKELSHIPVLLLHRCGRHGTCFLLVSSEDKCAFCWCIVPFQSFLELIGYPFRK